MSWFRNFLHKIIVSRKAKKTDTETSVNNKSFQTSTSNKKMETKVSYLYPKGKFRFPVISDQEKLARNRQSETKINSQDTVYEDSTAKMKKHLKVKESERNKPFQSTEIPSPIYGFHPIQREKTEIETTDSLSGSFKEKKFDNKQEDSVPRDYCDNKVDNKMSPIATGPPVAHHLPAEEAEEKIEEHKDESTMPQKEFQSIQTSVSETDLQEAETTEETDQKTDIHIEKEKPVSNESKNDRIQNNEKIRRTNKSTIPFNVIMLKDDKRKLRRNNKQQRLQARQSKTKKNKKKTTMKKDSENETNLFATKSSYRFPSLQLLKPPIVNVMDTDWLKEKAQQLNETLYHFRVGAKVVQATQGPSVTRFEVEPKKGVKVSKITNLTNDIKLSLAAKDIRMEAPIPGKSTVGIEIPNEKSRPVFISEVIMSDSFKQEESPLIAALGLDISGHPAVLDLRKMPHGLIAGATGSGKSVCINSILISLLYKASPSELKLLLIDPKMVELSSYNNIPHLVSPVITDVKAATAALKWAVDEMERRYQLFADAHVRNMERYNRQANEKLPYIVIIIDELADLMMMSPTDVEESICRIAQKARACGIHLIIATQRPSVDVITGLIKANVPTRIAFAVSSQIDSRTIIDNSGAEKLLGNGDMLLLTNGTPKPIRLQGTFVSDEEIDQVIAFVRNQGSPNYLFNQEKLLQNARKHENKDELFLEACIFVVEQGEASASLLQRHFRIGYNRAARLMEIMESSGIVSEARGSKPRDVLVTEEEVRELQSSRMM